MSPTPGPWRRIGATVQAGSIADSNHEVVADCAFSGDLEDTQGEDNARLIAAAPELLKALELVLDVDGYSYGVRAKAVEQARAAIAKARGA